MGVQPERGRGVRRAVLSHGRRSVHPGRRLVEGIATLAKARTPITAKTVEAQTGLSYRAITRNPEAYALFCKHAAYFQPATRTTKPTRMTAAWKTTRPTAAA